MSFIDVMYMYTLVVLFQMYKTNNSIICSHNFFIILILMYPVQSLTRMLNILDKFSMGVTFVMREG